jgi:hypothetical protein
MSEKDRDEGRGFTVVDRRASATAAEAVPEATSERPSAETARFDFSMLMQSFAITALHHLGLTGESGEENLPLARQNIEILEILEAKTRGNLSSEEAHLLSTLLYEVRMHYVEASKQKS